MNTKTLHSFSGTSFVELELALVIMKVCAFPHYRCCFSPLTASSTKDVPARLVMQGLCVHPLFANSMAVFIFYLAAEMCLNLKPIFERMHYTLLYRTQKKKCNLEPFFVPYLEPSGKKGFPKRFFTCSRT